MLGRLGAFFLDILQVIVFAVAIFLFVYLLLLQPHKIKGSSMYHNFEDVEFLLTDKITYRFNEPKRGDVVVFKSPPDDRDEFIKRIIGLPGDKVLISGGKVYLNEKVLEENYLEETVYTSPGRFLAENQALEVPTDSYLVLGDNRPYSSDSRAWGFIEKSKITGRAWLVYWPIKKAGIIKYENLYEDPRQAPVSALYTF